VSVVVRPPVWAFVALFGGIPVWWALGLAGFTWPLLAVPMAAWLMTRPDVRYPPGFALWLLFLVFVLLSGAGIDGPVRFASYLYRASLYGSATVLLLFVYNVPSTWLSALRVTRVMSVVWLAAVVGGFAGLALTGVEFRSVTEVLLPQSVSSVPFIKSFVHPGFAEASGLLGYPVPRPKAPFNYTNQWGANLALLTPFAFAFLVMTRRPALRIAGACVLALSLIPVVVSLNRGLWLSLGVGILYMAVRLALRGDLRALGGVGALIAVLGLLLVASPLGTIVADRFANPNTESRAGLYVEAAEVVRESPVVGFGAPLRGEESPEGPNVGTHGQFWTVLVSQGLAGAVIYVAWLLTVLHATRRAPHGLLWMHAVVLVALVQLPFYSGLPAQLHIVMVAVAVVLREQRERAALPFPRESARSTAPTAFARPVRVQA
jgi:hypothetical protein